MFQRIRHTSLYRILLWLVLAICLGVIWQLGKTILLRPELIPWQDYVHFWAAGRLNLAGENPYDPVAVQQIKDHLAGRSANLGIVAVYYAPPWTIPLAMLFGLLPYLPSRLVWLLANISILLACAMWIWKMYAGPERQRWAAWLATLTFGPFYLILVGGQVTPLMLLGMVGFLYWVDGQRNDWLAGFSAALATFKPQLIYLFWPVLILWIIQERRWKILISFTLALFVGTALGLLFNPAIINQYIFTALNYSPTQWLSPTIGVLLRLIFGAEKLWLQYLPSLIGVIWLVIIWLKKRKTWGWLEQVPLIVFVSLLFTFHGWTGDLVLLLLAILPAWIRLVKARQQPLVTILAVIYGLLNLGYFLSRSQGTDLISIWFAPALFLWYVIVYRFTRPDEGLNGPIAPEPSGL